MQVDVLAPHAAGAKRHEIIDGINVYRYSYFFSRLQNLTYKGGILANLKNNPLNYLLVPLLILAQGLALYRRLAATEYRYIHAHWIIPQAMIATIVLSITGKQSPALICTSHGGDLYALNTLILNRIKRWTIDRCAHFCVVSNAMKQKAIELGGAAEKIRVMPMGVDLVDVFRPVAAVRRSEHRIIYVGRLVEKKGVRFLIEAMSTVIRSFPDAELLIVGDGPLRAGLEAQVTEAGINAHVRFHGSVQHNHLPALYSSASIAVVPSVIAASGDQEGLGLVIIEALGCECAVVASDLEAISDVLDPHTGCLARPGDAADLAAKITLLLKDPVLRKDLAIRGRHSVAARFDSRITAASYYRLMTD
jgi:glycosyltransferase involved in cell wall biosynthesis